MSRFNENKVNRKNTELRRYKPGKRMYSAVRRLVTSLSGGTSRGTLPPMMEIMKRYPAMAGERIVFGTSSTTTVNVTPTHISPMMLDGIKLMNAHGGFKNRAPAANGAAITWKRKRTKAVSKHIASVADDCERETQVQVREDWVRG